MCSFVSVRVGWLAPFTRHILPMHDTGITMNTRTIIHSWPQYQLIGRTYILPKKGENHQELPLNGTPANIAKRLKLYLHPPHKRMRYIFNHLFRQQMNKVHLFLQLPKVYSHTRRTINGSAWTGPDHHRLYLYLVGLSLTGRIQNPFTTVHKMASQCFYCRLFVYLRGVLLPLSTYFQSPIFVFILLGFALFSFFLWLPYCFLILIGSVWLAYLSPLHPPACGCRTKVADRVSMRPSSFLVCVLVDYL